MWTWENVNTDWDNFSGPKTPITSMLSLKFSRETTTETLAWSKTSQLGRKFSNSSCNWGISWSLQQKILAEKNTWPQCWYQQSPYTWVNNQIGSEGGWRSGQNKQKDLCDSAAVEYDGSRELIGSSPIVWRKWGKWEVSTKCFCEF